MVSQVRRKFQSRWLVVAPLWGPLAISLLLAQGCTEQRPAGFVDNIVISGPLAAGNRFVYVNRTFDELVVMQASTEGGEPDAEIRHLPLGDGPLSPIVSPDEALVLTINGGDQTASLVRLDDLSEYRFDLPSDYDSARFSSDGRFVVTYFGNAAAGGSSDSVFRNQNEITVLDLNPSGAPGGFDGSQVDTQVLSLRSSPLGFDFAPPFTIDGVTHQLLVVHAISALTLVEPAAEAEQDRQRRLFFVPEQSTTELIPRRIIFTADIPKTTTT
jgi:hypothetical protein